jgi:hypothetical protein
MLLIRFCPRYFVQQGVGTGGTKSGRGSCRFLRPPTGTRRIRNNGFRCFLLQDAY